jgi:hypothetical protein
LNVIVPVIVPAGRLPGSIFIVTVWESVAEEPPISPVILEEPGETVSQLGLELFAVQVSTDPGAPVFVTVIGTPIGLPPDVPLADTLVWLRLSCARGFQRMMKFKVELLEVAVCEGGLRDGKLNAFALDIKVLFAKESIVSKLLSGRLGVGTSFIESKA